MNRTKDRGITLVALVITIIILLILAGISIASLTGSGLFEKAKLAKEKQENAQLEEDETLADYENKIREQDTNQTAEEENLVITEYADGLEYYYDMKTTAYSTNYAGIFYIQIM